MPIENAIEPKNVLRVFLVFKELQLNIYIDIVTTPHKESCKKGIYTPEGLHGT